MNCTFTSGWRMQRARADSASRSVTVDADVGVELARARDQRVRARHVGRDGELEDGHLPGLGEPARDRPADARQRDRLDLGRRGAGAAGAAGAARRRPARPARARRPRRRSARRGRCPSPCRARPALARHPARERRGLDPAAVLLARAVDHGAGTVDSLGRAARASAGAGSLRRAPRSRLGRRRSDTASPSLADDGDRLPDRHLALGDRDPRAARRSPPPRPPGSPCRCRPRRAARPSRRGRPRP